jgi:Mlc titration factor MtfA (ptsG expression regulator)
MTRLNKLTIRDFRTLAEKALSSLWQPGLSELRLLADSLRFCGDTRLSERVWRLVEQKSIFPETFLASRVASFIGRRKTAAA